MILELTKYGALLMSDSEKRISDIFRNFRGLKDQITVYNDYVTIISVDLFIHVYMDHSIVMHHFTDLFLSYPALFSSLLLINIHKLFLYLNLLFLYFSQLVIE